MARKCISFAIFAIYIQCAAGVGVCLIDTENGTQRSVCCADYELKDDYCIACSKGYTSEIGQNCKPCANKTYGERCRHDCFCTSLEICDVVKGCVEIPVQATSDTTTLAIVLDERTIGNISDSNVQGLSSIVIITYYTLSLTVAVFGICLCFAFYKCKIVTEKTKATIN